MRLDPGLTLILMDAQHRLLAYALLESNTADLLTGAWRPGPDYAAVESLFRDFEEAVNSQSLAAVERLDAAISNLGLSLALPDRKEHQPIHDVQIWSDGGFSCRPGTPVGPSLNGMSAARSAGSTSKPK
jgi:hypothetical protein